jgi:Flp pilus assembly protein TadG
MPLDRRFRAARRRGVSTFESILVLVVLIIASLAAFQFGLALIVKQTVSHAATVSAREAAKGATADELICVVNRLFQEYHMQIGPDVSLVLEDPTALLPIEQRGTLTCVPPATPVLDFDEVRVTVCVSLTAGPFVNILKFYGIDYTGRTFEISSVATKE